jgi:hypothetical protein
MSPLFPEERAILSLASSLWVKGMLTGCGAAQTATEAKDRQRLFWPMERAFLGI